MYSPSPPRASHAAILYAAAALIMHQFARVLLIYGMPFNVAELLLLPTFYGFFFNTLL